MSVCLRVFVCVCVRVCPYKSTHHSSDCDEAFRSWCDMPAVVLKILKKKKQLKIVIAVVPGVALSLQEHTRFIWLQWNFHKLL